MQRASLGLERLQSYLSLQELALGVFSITWDIPKWHEYDDFSFHFSFYGIPEENCRPLSLLRDKELQ